MSESFGPVWLPLRYYGCGCREVEGFTAWDLQRNEAVESAADLMRVQQMRASEASPGGYAKGWGRLYFNMAAPSSIRGLTS